jgi:AcrR family transcriptional regulator
MEQRLPLSRAAIVAAAVAVADRDGLDRLSMRRLGRHFGVEAMSLYNHVPNKAALLDAMVDEALDAIPVPTDPDWRTGLRGRCLAQRRVFQDHRWALGVVDSRGTPGPATLRRHDATLGYLRRTGFSTRAAGHAYVLLDAYVMGFVLQEQDLTFDAAPGMAGSMPGVHPLAELPHLEELFRETERTGDDANEFEKGLDLLLDSLATLVTPGPRTGTGSRRGAARSTPTP